jgi:hypothetical protein
MSFANLSNYIGLVFLALSLIAIVIAALASPAVRTALGRAMGQRSFLIVTLVLLTAALGLNVAVSAMKLHFKKEAVPLAKALGAIPDKFGPWVQVSQDQPLDHETQDVLGTKEYIFRDYVNETDVPGVADRFRGKPKEERLAMLNQIRQQFPTAVISLSVTYYTGMVDTVAHVPDRCVTADGYEPKEYTTPRWPIALNLPAGAKPQAADGTPLDDVEVRYINFEDQTGAAAAKLPRSITYFFHTNGKFVSSPLEVRNQLANLFVKKGYYAKIETMTTIADTKVSADKTANFLSYALPEVHKCMPDWEKVMAGEGPTAVASK